MIHSINSTGDFSQMWNVQDSPAQLKSLSVLVQEVIFHPVVATATLGCRAVKLLTWVPAKAGIYIVSGFYTEAASYFESEYLKTVKALRDLLFIPSSALRAFKDLTAPKETYRDDFIRKGPSEFLKIAYDKGFQPYSSRFHGYKTFEVCLPKGIREFKAVNDGSLNTVMASHFLKPDVMAINFGLPNVATFVTEEGENGVVQTMKVDAKSLHRDEMSYHPTGGKIQSGVFVIPTNLPIEALNRFKEAAQKLEGRSDVTCVNTNCRVLAEAGFSIEGVALDEVIFPVTLMEHLLFRNVFYQDSNGIKHKVHFSLVNTTSDNLETHLEKVDTAVVSTRLRHKRRNTDTEESRIYRGEAAAQLIAEEKVLLAQREMVSEGTPSAQERRQVTISAPSYLGDAIGRIWGRHTIYELDLSDKKERMAEVFDGPALRPFPQEHPDAATRLKRDLLFSGPVISFLRRHIMGREDKIDLYTQDLFKHLQSTRGERLNYTLLDDKIILARVHANGDEATSHRKIADWALSKHALLANRQDVYCSGEIWHDQDKQCFMMNGDSGTYKPDFTHIEKTVALANEIFKTNSADNFFQIAPAEVA